MLVSYQYSTLFIVLGSQLTIRKYLIINTHIISINNIFCISHNCGDTIRGRTDKKFCSDQCRNNFNNRLNRDSNNFVRNVHGLLRKNRRILSDLYSENKIRIHKDALFALGYNFSFFTHVIETSQGNKFHFCFEYGYRDIGNDFLELSMNSQYLEYQ